MKRWMRKASLVLGTGLALSLLVACGESLSGSQSSDDGDDTATGEWPETIVYGVLPTEDTEELMSSYAPFEEYMSSCLDNPFELFTGTDYTAMIEAMRTGNLHISKFGPFSYILASERAGAEAMVQPVDDSGEPTYTSMIVTLESYGFESVAVLEGEPFAFVDATSTSGYLFPRAMMLEEIGLGPDEIDDWLGNVVFSGGHDASAIAVLNGDVKAAAISSNLWHKGVVENGDFDSHQNIDDLVILAETDAIPRTVEAIQGDLPDDLKEQAKACFESSLDEPSLNDFFFEDSNTAGGYVSATDDAFDIVRSTAETLGVSPDDLLED